MEKLLQNGQVQTALKFLKADQPQLLQDLLSLVAIPAFSTHEKEKSEAMLQRFQELGLDDVHMDEVYNVFGTLKGSQGTPKIMLAGHVDTVFPMDTDIKPWEQDGIYHAPGIADDTLALAEILSIVRAVKSANLKPVGDIVFCANVCEEGLGDLKGSKHIFRKNHGLDAFISIDGTGVAGIVYQAAGSFRYRFSFTGKGGHSYNNFGQPNPIHALGRTIAKISNFQVPKTPKTTFSVGVIEGGTSINAIAEQASFLLDIRSSSQEELLRLEAEATAAAEAAVAEENGRWESSEQVKLQIEKIGSRPSGSQPADCLLVQVASEALQALGLKPELKGPSSTDANIPISLGVPALSVGRGGRSGGGHTTREWLDPTDVYLGPQKDLLTIFALAGLESVLEPKLKK